LRRLVFVALLLVGSLLVTTVAVAGKPRLEKKRLRPADMTLAKRTTLRASDLPRRWTRTRPEQATNQLPTCPGVDMDFSAFTITGMARSAFQAGAATAESQVEVFVNRSDAARDFRKGTSAPVLRCLGRWLRDQAAKEQPGTRVVMSRLLSRPRLGEQAVLYRIVMEVPTSVGRIRVYVDIVGFQRGRTTVALAFGSAEAPPRGHLGVAAKVAARTR
jgi:hypothetical protein